MVDIGKREDRLLDYIATQRDQIRLARMQCELWAETYPAMASAFRDIQEILRSLDKP